MVQLLNQHTGLYTDHYELSMAQGYLMSGMKDTPAVFDYFFRKNPYEGGYVVFAGLEELLELLHNFRFDGAACSYLSGIGFHDDFISYLKEFRFHADIYSVQEGEIVFPDEPCVRVEGNIIETQLVETMLLNVLNFHSLIATKAARLREAAGDHLLVDFGLRRAQGYGGIQASSAAIAGGVNQTSNVFSAFQYGLQSSGTMAHSWVQSFEDELEAFRTFAKIFPEQCILLVDTYDTLESGVPNAIKVGLEMEKQGKKLLGIRLDSGDLSYLSKKARGMLDWAGLEYVHIVASNQLDEHVIKSLKEQSAPIDAFGVGTALTTGKGAGALDGVYKISMVNRKPTLKVSENIRKSNLPGRKSIFRFRNDRGKFMADGIFLEGEKESGTLHHPYEQGKSSDVSCYKREQINEKVMENGKALGEKNTPAKIAERVRTGLDDLPPEHKRFMNPHVYKVGISSELLEMRNDLRNKKMK
ncbi:MAG: nicotinate phosphoribosyltransferase [Bacteroidales bacterium]